MAWNLWLVGQEGHVPSLKRIYVFHLHGGSQQAVNLGIHLGQVPDGLWPSPPHPKHGVYVFALAKSRCTELP